ncbi:small secreted protein [Streptomyces sp. CA-294286]|uniref:small secreted protein n=1 Tax=Streptomyces sp. CA-294286 TaxID=3240070 RepID=UPI003D8DBDBF
MNKKLAAALSGGAVLMMAATLTACGDSPEEKAKKEQAAWSKSYCPKEKAAEEKRVKADGLLKATAADGKPEDIKKADSEAFQMYAEAARDRIKALRDAGPPPVANGERDHKEMIKNLEGQATAFDNLKKQADALDPKGKEFPKGLDKLGEDLGKVGELPVPKSFCPSSGGAGAPKPA